MHKALHGLLVSGEREIYEVRDFYNDIESVWNGEIAGANWALED